MKKLMITALLVFIISAYAHGDAQKGDKVIPPHEKSKESKEKDGEVNEFGKKVVKDAKKK